MRRRFSGWHTQFRKTRPYARQHMILQSITIRVFSGGDWAAASNDGQQPPVFCHSCGMDPSYSAHMMVFYMNMSRTISLVIGVCAVVVIVVVRIWLGEAILVKYAPWYISHLPSAFPSLSVGRKTRRRKIKHSLLDHGGDAVPPPVTSPKRLEAKQRGVDRVFSECLLADTSGSVGRPANSQSLLAVDARECVRTQGD